MTLSPGPKIQPKRSTRPRPEGSEALQFEIEGSSAEPAPVHWAKHLHIADRVQSEPAGDAPGHDLQQLDHPVFRAWQRTR